jgi:ketosteroid isomerase-like protein
MIREHESQLRASQLTTLDRVVVRSLSRLGYDAIAVAVSGSRCGEDQRERLVADIGVFRYAHRVDRVVHRLSDEADRHAALAHVVEATAQGSFRSTGPGHVVTFAAENGSRCLHQVPSGVASPVVTLSPSDISGIRAAERSLAQAFESPDLTAWVDFYTDDAIFVGPGAAAIEGRAALLEVAPHISISSMEIEAQSTFGAGDLAATYGRASWVSGPKGSDSRTVRRRFLMVWRRDLDGGWRIAREMLNEDL